MSVEQRLILELGHFSFRVYVVFYSLISDMYLFGDHNLRVFQFSCMNFASLELNH